VKADALKTIKDYENIETFAKPLGALYNVMSPEIFFKFIRD